MTVRRAWHSTILCFVILAAACSGAQSGQQPSSTPDGSPAPAAAASAATPPAAAVDDATVDRVDREAEAEAQKLLTLPDIRDKRWTGDLDGMIERRVIRVLTTYSKINYFVDQGRPRGLIYDAFRQFEDELNTKLKTKNVRVHVVFIPVAHDQLVPYLLEGRGDVVAAGTLLLDWRREQVDFTNPTRTGVSSVIVTGPGVPPLASAMDLGGREVYLRLSDVSQKGVDAFNAELVKAGKPPVKILPAPEILGEGDLIEMVNAGLVPATMVDDYIADFWKKIFPDIVVNRVAAVRTNLETGMLIRKGSPQLKAELNGYIARYPEGSLRRNLLLQEYLGNLKYARNATSQAERAKFDRTVKLFRQYAGQYEVDFLLMAAQGYQESRLDQGIKSPVGAIGVMQVMPATGKELGVGDIKVLEPNIHAGVKYMRQMMDRYYGNEPMAPLDKALFTFASYNAGPARIRGLRARAAERGLDPNVWFNNVEVVASEAIGRETVQYVSNIYKYYLAYSLLTEQAEQRRRAREAVAGR